jgi:bifunctional DNA-binding transcriptional regulator/antitoxin component of YhaV-PrlF toxin-antitoxin module
MSETVSVDEKGRLVLPKKIREKARIGVNVKLVAKASGIGRVELSDPRILVAQAQEIGAKKLARWREEDHQAATYLLRSMRTKNETH